MSVDQFVSLIESIPAEAKKSQDNENGLSDDKKDPVNENFSDKSLNTTEIPAVEVEGTEENGADDEDEKDLLELDDIPLNTTNISLLLSEISFLPSLTADESTTEDDVRAADESKASLKARLLELKKRAEEEEKRKENSLISLRERVKNIEKMREKLEDYRKKRASGDNTVVQVLENEVGKDTEISEPKLPEKFKSYAHAVNSK